MNGRRAGVGLLICMVVGAAGCGNSGGAKSATATATPTSAAGTTAPAVPAAKAPAALRRRVLAAGDMYGFAPAGEPFFASDARSWDAAVQASAADHAATVARLQRLGFVAGVREDLTESGGAPGLSFVERFRSATAARTELGAVASLTGGFRAFPVAGTPGARGFAISDGAQISAANVAFADGPYVYLVGATRASSGPSARIRVIAAARRLYRRVHH